MKNLIFSILMAAASVFLTTCAESPEVNPGPTPGPGSNPPPPSGDITDEQRLKVLKECGDFVDALGDLKSDASQQLVVTWLKAQPEFEEAGVLGGNVWAYFRDGRPVMIIPDWLHDEGEGGGRSELPYNGGRTSPAPSTERTTGQPANNEVKMWLGLGSAFTDYRLFLKNFFDKSKTEYHVTMDVASVENFETLKDAGVFYVNTHGGLGLKKPRSANQRIFGLWTTDTTSLANERRYTPKLNSFKLLYMYALEDPESSEWHYAISDIFVREGEMTFPENAMFVIDACNGMSSDAQVFRDAMIEKADDGKATYIGWTAPTSLTAEVPAIGFMFERMLGTNINVNAPSLTIAPENPAQRPFDLGKVYDDMGNFRVGHLPLGYSVQGGHLAYHSVNTSEIILTPSIEYIAVDENQSQISINGLFGDDPHSDGKVTVGGLQVQIKGWTPNLIVCDIPTTGFGSYGNVVVSVRGNESNAVPLSQWEIPLHLVRDEMGIKLDTRLTLKLRADIHPYRSNPGEAPRKERPEFAEMLASDDLGWPFAISSIGSFVVGGQRQMKCEPDENGCVMEITETLASRNGSFNSTPQAGTGFSAFYKWSVDMRTLYVRVGARVSNLRYDFRFYQSCPGSEPIDTKQGADGAELGVETESDLPVLVFHLDENNNIQADEMVKSEDYTWTQQNCIGGGKLIARATWSGASPIIPPKSDTPARLAKN